MSHETDIRRRIEVRIGQGEFLANLLHVASRQSSGAQDRFVDALSRIAARVRGLLETNEFIRRLPYRPLEFWREQHGRTIAFVDGGVANIELPSAAPIGIRVGSYIVKPGDETSERERFHVELSLVDDLYSDEGIVYDDDLDDIAKLRDAARMTSELAVGYRLAKSTPSPDIIILHGPLINPVSPYGMETFPAFGIAAARAFLDDPTWSGERQERKFVALYLEILERLRSTKRPVAGAVERSIGRDPVVIRQLLNQLQDDQVLTSQHAHELLDEVRRYGLNDASLLDVVLEEGEFIAPVAIMRQGPENKWPEEWKPLIRSYPKALTTYLKPSDVVMPFRLEAFEDTKAFDAIADLILHTSRLLPSYGFPVGLDIADKFAKVPEWMSRSVRRQHQVVLLQKAIATGDPSVITFAKRVLAARGRDWFFRPACD